MSASTPISKTKSQALTRVVDVISRGYTRWISGNVKASKAEALAEKFHRLYGIGCTPAQRITRKKHGFANALLVMYWPEPVKQVEWLVLATNGEGLDGEVLTEITDRRRLQFLGYELVRHAHDGNTRWTWRRPKAEMADHYTLLAELSGKRHWNAVNELLQRLAHQPGFNGVRTQTWDLCQEARRRGYQGELPHLFYMQKISHGDQLIFLP
ncbi:MAG: hypothetical protein ACYCSZ_05340 [Burkholderiales bacterium]